MSGESNRITENSFYKAWMELDENPNRLDFKPLGNENVFADNSRDKLFGGDLWQFRLNRQYDVWNTYQPPPPPNPDPQKVADALGTIRSSLSEGITDWDVSHGDLDAIRDAFTNLTAEEANEVFRQLSDGDLNKWADELDGALGGYNREEKQQLFNELAGELNGENLARFARNLSDDNFNLQDLGSAIGQNASSAAKIDFVRNFGASVEDNRPASQAVAEVIAGLQNDPAALDQAIGTLSDNRLQEIMDNISIDSYQVGSWYGQAAQTVHYDGELLGRMLGAVSASSDPEVKARVFHAGALQLKKIDEAPGIMPSSAIIGKDDAARNIREALTVIIESDTEGAITELNKDRMGEGLVAYVKSMLNAGDESQKKLGVFISRLLTGNDNDQNQLARFEQQTSGTLGSEYYQNARTLGYFAGAIHAATDDIAKDNERKGNILKNIFDTAAGIIGAKFPVEAALGKGLSIEMVDQLTAIENGRSFNLRDTLIRLTFPVVPDDTPDNYNDNDVYTGPAVTPYEAAFDSISD